MTENSNKNINYNTTQDFQNTLYTNDNLYVLRRLDSESVDLIYLDPPFNSKREYDAPTGSLAEGASFNDIWKWEEDVDEAYLGELGKTHPDLVKYIFSIGQLHSEAMMSYITYMTQRVLEMHRILKPTGSLYYHCDPTAGHFVKLMLDGIFGRKNFRNEICWCYDKWTAPSDRQLQRNHDLIYYYSKTEKPYFNSLTEIDDKRKITLERGYTTNLLHDGTRQLIVYEGSENKDNISKLMKSKKFKNVLIRPLEKLGKPLKDWWQINIIHPKAKYRTGYPTQKPAELLERIIKQSCPKDGVVLDPFCGCGTTCVVAKHLGIHWIGIDISNKTPITIKHIYQNKYGEGMLYKEDYIIRKDLPHRHDLKIEKIEDNLTRNEIKKRLYEQQNGRCNGCLEHFDIKNLEIDHIFPKAKGGEDNYENFQLLCGYCNKVKGSRPMEYLKRVLDANKDILTYKLTYGNQDFEKQE